MEKDKIQEIIECLPKGRTKFYYFRDRYALMLLSYAVGQGKAIREMKTGPYQMLISKPLVRDVIKNCGSGQLSSKDLDSVWPAQYNCYLLTLGVWGDDDRGSRFYNQTSRPGLNLVLQLNFSMEHNRSYENLLKPGDREPFKTHSHPIAGQGHHTLSWARIDLDIETGEALIEEIQTDWIRYALDSKKDLKRALRCSCLGRRCMPAYIRNLGGGPKGLARYLEQTLEPHIKTWDEAMLASTIWFLKEEIGIKTIYYHTYDLGCRLKRISGDKPPRSLYTRLPDKFCFSKTSDAPSFLLHKNNRKTINELRKKDIQFYTLVF